MRRNDAEMGGNSCGIVPVAATTGHYDAAWSNQRLHTKASPAQRNEPGDSKTESVLPCRAIYNSHEAAGDQRVGRVRKETGSEGAKKRDGAAVPTKSYDDNLQGARPLIRHWMELNVVPGLLFAVMSPSIGVTVTKPALKAALSEFTIGSGTGEK